MHATRGFGPGFHGALLVLALVLALVSACGLLRAPVPWQPVTLPTDADFRGIWFTDSLNGWITGGGHRVSGGIIGHTRDGGRTWSIRTGIVPGAYSGFALHRVQFLDSLRGYVAADRGLLLFTEDGGENWRNVRNDRRVADALVGVQFLDSRTGWAIGPASIVGTQDGGESWQGLVYNSAENGYLSGRAFHFVDATRGWLVGPGGLLMRSSDGGKTWMRVALPLGADERPALWDVTFTDARHGWVVGEEGVVFRTADFGATWERDTTGVPIVRPIPRGEPPRSREPFPELETPPARLTLSAVRFADAQHGFAAGYYADVGESVVLATRDGGVSWRTECVAPGQELRALFVLDRTHAWAVGNRVRTGAQVLLRYRGPGR